MNWKTGNIDMLHGPLTGKLLWFTLPIALSSILQQLFNAADTAIVGRFASADALAAVGTNTEVIALIVTVSSGLGLGANILVARRIGQGRTDEIPAATQTAILLSVLVGFLGLLAGQAAAGPLLRLIQTPEDIFPSALLYLRLYLLGYPFLLLYDFGSAVLRAHGDSRFPFWALALSGLANVVLNLFFVLVCSMGVAGVAVATDISTALSALLVLGRLSKTGSLRRPRLSPALVGEILATGVPSAVQGAVFCFANLFVQASVNPFGETAIAGNTIAMSFEYITFYIITAFGQTATTFTSQNHAAGQRARCRRILWLCLGLSTLCSSLPIFTIVLFRDAFSGLFSPEGAVVEFSTLRIPCILLFEPLCNLYEIPAGALRGSGHPVYPAACTMIGTCAFRILWICTVFQRRHTLAVLYHSFPLSWVVNTLLVSGGYLFFARRAAERSSHT